MKKKNVHNQSLIRTTSSNQHKLKWKYFKKRMFDFPEKLHKKVVLNLASFFPPVRNHRTLRLEKTSKVIQSNCSPTTNEWTNDYCVHFTGWSCWKINVPFLKTRNRETICAWKNYWRRKMKSNPCLKVTMAMTAITIENLEFCKLSA